MLERYDEVIELARKELRGAPNSIMANQLLWLAHHYKGEYNEAFKYAKVFFTAMGMSPIINRDMKLAVILKP